MPPLGQYLPWSERGSEPLAPMAAHKGHGPRHRRLFLLQTGRFSGCRSGATMVIMDPGQLGQGGVSGWGPCPRRGSTSRVGKAMILAISSSLRRGSINLSLFMPLPPRRHGRASRSGSTAGRGHSCSSIAILNPFRPRCCSASARLARTLRGCCSRSWNTHCLGARGPTADARPTRVQKTGGWPRCERDPAGRTMSSRSFTR
jgi:hypothetical protein